MTAYLSLTKEIYNLSNKWDYYLTYQPLGPTSTDEEVEEFFNRKAENCCSMCPSTRQPLFQKGDPLLSRKIYELNLST